MAQVLVISTCPATSRLLPPLTEFAMPQYGLRWPQNTNSSGISVVNWDTIGSPGCYHLQCCTLMYQTVFTWLAEDDDMEMVVMAVEACLLCPYSLLWSCPFSWEFRCNHVFSLSLQNTCSVSTQKSTATILHLDIRAQVFKKSMVSSNCRVRFSCILTMETFMLAFYSNTSVNHMTTTLANNLKKVRVDGWPQITLSELGMKDLGGGKWELLQILNWGDLGITQSKYCLLFCNDYHLFSSVSLVERYHNFCSPYISNLIT